ncbi:MAG: hypothetical protein M3Z83_07805, partial [Actinomycetota bacterium]|nr:hypothetical protein [Actinomycetota bacterium]
RVVAPYTEGWSAAYPEPDAGHRTMWLVAYLGIDAVFIVIYGVIIARWLAASWPAMARLLRILAVVDGLEDGLALVAGTVAAPAAAPLAWATGLASAAKWVLTLGVALFVVWKGFTPAGRAAVGTWRLAFYKQRFSILAVLPIAILSIPGGSDLLDQMPDVQRRWLRDGHGALHALFAVVAIILVTVGLLLMGRMRSSAVWRRTPESVQAERPALLRLGLVAPGIVVVGMLWLWVRGSGTPWAMPGLNPARTAVFLAVPIVVMLASWVIRHSLAARGTPRGAGWFVPALHSVPTEEEKRAIVLAGDIIAVSAMLVAGLSFVRSFTSVVALGAVGLIDWSWWGAVAWLAGVGVAILAWPICRWTFAVVTHETEGPVGEAEDDLRRWFRGLSSMDRTRVLFTPSSPLPQNESLRLGALVVGVALFFVVGSFGWVGDFFGVIGTALLALLAASLVIGGSVVAVQDRLAPELFWFRWIRASSLPITTLLVVTVVWTSGMGSNIDVHGVRGLVSTSEPRSDPALRPSLLDAVGDWVTAGVGCGHEVTAAGQRYRLRPMLLLAAEGGGIRAAYWTAGSVDLLRGTAAAGADGKVSWATGNPENICARALFGGGASGGAVGLAVARFSGTDSARARVVAMSGPNALASATTGLFVRDTAYAATGVPFFGGPATPANTTTGPRWLDRGGLIEVSWERTSGLGTPFLPDVTDPAWRSATGALVLNSTRVADGCRMWVSQLRLATAGVGDCDSPTMPSGHTTDLLASLSNGTAGRTMTPTDRCLGPITAATGALLASRFPFVTPSGVLGPCAGQPEQQLVDGGYVENTGLATILDLAPTWLSEVQRRNAVALAGVAPVKEILVPVVVYLDNGTGGDLVKDAPSQTSEILVPSTTTGVAKAALLDAPALLTGAERAIAAASLFGAGAASPPDAELISQIDTWRGSAVVVVHQSTFPAVTAPLGWVLSGQSMETMDRALAQQARSTDTAGAVESVSTRGTLADALRLVRPDAK